MEGTQFHTSFSSPGLFLCNTSCVSLVQIGSAESSEFAVLCSRNHVICHPEEPSLRERERERERGAPPTPTHTWVFEPPTCENW